MQKSHSGWNKWRKMSGVLNDKRMPPYVKDDKTEENTSEILQHSDININNS